MRALLDTHVFLWWITDDPSLSERARRILADGSNELYLSAASAWEMAVKARLGRLDLPEDPESFLPEHLRRNAIKGLPIHLSHALHVYALPAHHRDPFDRMILSQSQLEGLPILTADPRIADYGVDVVW